jgi:hypothetical protein
VQVFRATGGPRILRAAEKTIELLDMFYPAPIA